MTVLESFNPHVARMDNSFLMIVSDTVNEAKKTQSLIMSVSFKMFLNFLIFKIELLLLFAGGLFLLSIKRSLKIGLEWHQNIRMGYVINYIKNQLNYI